MFLFLIECPSSYPDPSIPGINSCSSWAIYNITNFLDYCNNNQNILTKCCWTCEGLEFNSI